jgi:hypothetical protein
VPAYSQIYHEIRLGSSGAAKYCDGAAQSREPRGKTERSGVFARFRKESAVTA